MTDLHFRRAVAADLPAIVRMLADDPIGQGREAMDDALDTAYSAAFSAIDADPNQLLAVAEDDRGVIGTLQLSFIPGLSRKGAWRGQIEAVRVARDCRSEGLGRRMIEWAIAECRSRGCALVQLTTDKARPDAHRFYEQLGFVASHIGYKLSF
ncbi:MULTISPECIES: GNAT family N-acetyltransferase [unclassified Rhizobium]|uniref:GNAT family N-acetyltransferase n=1 Tax=unclassified Rhizobium TaxID=2613769 RepID=UPI0006F6D6A5|nr:MULTISPECIES: GNAT family N-acetyltransferase [unclassified Rhizobium]KQV43644.1 GNAT family acetyltransferase [Rhizobium sp. Root1212]KRD37828.1 GNAT family acetyltransferase [Rhizobium sp. Root268]